MIIVLENALNVLGTMESLTGTPVFSFIVYDRIRYYFEYFGLIGNSNKLRNQLELSSGTSRLRTCFRCLHIVFLCRDSHRLAINQCNIDLQSILLYHIQITIR